MRSPFEMEPTVEPETSTDASETRWIKALNATPLG
jgi:hypothetical protein